MSSSEQHAPGTKLADYANPVYPKELFVTRDAALQVKHEIDTAHRLRHAEAERYMQGQGSPVDQDPCCETPAPVSAETLIERLHRKIASCHLRRHTMSQEILTLHAEEARLCQLLADLS